MDIETKVVQLDSSWTEALSRVALATFREYHRMAADEPNVYPHCSLPCIWTMSAEGSKHSVWVRFVMSTGYWDVPVITQCRYDFYKGIDGEYHLDSRLS